MNEHDVTEGGYGDVDGDAGAGTKANNRLRASQRAHDVLRDPRQRQRRTVRVLLHGSADINRDFSYESLADDIAAMLDYLEIRQADLLGYSMGGDVAMQVAIRHPDKVRKVVSVSAFFRREGLVKEALDAFPNFVKRVVAMALKPYDFGADRLKATQAPFLFIRRCRRRPAGSHR